MSGLLTELVDKRTLRRWRTSAEAAGSMDVADLNALRKRARSLARQVDQVLNVAEGRLALPMAEKAPITQPLHSDWAWRPDLWSGPVKPVGLALVETKTLIGRQAKIFHDCPASELCFRQVRNPSADDVAPFGVRLDVFRFEGSFLSLVVDLPEVAIEQLTKRHVFRLDIRLAVEKEMGVFGRLNVRHGPNIEQIVREFDGCQGACTVEFDLSPTVINEARVDRAWVDLIFDRPDMNEITLRDVTLSRRPRAEL